MRDFGFRRLVAQADSLRAARGRSSTQSRRLSARATKAPKSDIRFKGIYGNDSAIRSYRPDAGAALRDALVAPPKRIYRVPAQPAGTTYGSRRVATASPGTHAAPGACGRSRHGSSHPQRRLHSARNPRLERAAIVRGGPVLIVSILLLLFVTAAPAATADSFLGITLAGGKGGASASVPMQITILLTLLTLLPAAIMSVTPFLRISIVLHFLR